MPHHHQPAATEAPRLSAEREQEIRGFAASGNLFPPPVRRSSAVEFLTAYDALRASLAAATARAEAASESCWCKDIQPGSEWVRVCEALHAAKKQAEAALASERATSERLRELLLPPIGDEEVGIVTYTCLICDGPGQTRDAVDHKTWCWGGEALAQHARATDGGIGEA